MFGYWENLVHILRVRYTRCPPLISDTQLLISLWKNWKAATRSQDSAQSSPHSVPKSSWNLPNVYAAVYDRDGLYLQRNKKTSKAFRADLNTKKPKSGEGVFTPVSQPGGMHNNVSPRRLRPFILEEMMCWNKLANKTRKTIRDARGVGIGEERIKVQLQRSTQNNTLSRCGLVDFTSWSFSARLSEERVNIILFQFVFNISDSCPLKKAWKLRSLP